jgi:hypothetical protein
MHSNEGRIPGKCISAPMARSSTSRQAHLDVSIAQEEGDHACIRTERDGRERLGD